MRKAYKTVFLMGTDSVEKRTLNKYTIELKRSFLKVKLIKWDAIRNKSNGARSNAGLHAEVERLRRSCLNDRKKQPCEALGQQSATWQEKQVQRP